MDIKKGDMVVLGNDSPWSGSEGIVTGVSESNHIEMTFTKTNEGNWMSVGSSGRPKRSSVVKVTPGSYPRKVDLADVKVGDTVRVTYPTQTVEAFGVTEVCNRTREAEVRIVNGKKLLSGDGGAINNSYKGFEEATYEIIQPAKKSWVETAEIGDKFLLMDENGNTVFTKDRPYDWTIYFNGEKDSRSSASVQGLWGTADVIKL